MISILTVALQEIYIEFYTINLSYSSLYLQPTTRTLSFTFLLNQEQNVEQAREIKDGRFLFGDRSLRVNVNFALYGTFIWDRMGPFILSVSTMQH